MVNFGKRLQALQYSPWKGQYLDYNRLKGVLETDVTNDLAAFREREFVRQLNREIEKIVLFFLEQQGILAARLSTLREQERECSLQARELATHSGSEDILLTKLNGLSQQYREVGEDLIHFIHYVELNVTGIRKILKKHDKLYKGNKLSDRYLSEHYGETQDSHLKQLLHHEGVGALAATLQESLMEIHVLECILKDSMTQGTNRHRRSITAPGPFDMQHEIRLRDIWKPTTPQTASKQALAFGTLQDWTSESEWKDPTLLRIDAARRRLHESSNFVRVLAAGELLMMERISSEQDLVELEAPYVPPHKVSRISNILNLLSTFLYLTNYYIVAPSSGHYASKLGGNEALAGLIIGMTPIASLVSTILYSWWTSHSYKAALIFASACSIIGNILYALGLPCNSILLVMVGRLLTGFGSVLSINRRYIADSFSRHERTAAFAAFVTAGALGMAAGPALAAILDLVTPDNNIFWSTENSPGWIMGVIWSIYLIVLVLKFQDPPRNGDIPKSTNVEMAGEEKALLSNLDQKDDEVESATPPLWQNIPVVMTLFLCFVLKMALECCLSSTSTLTGYYFDWGTQASGVYLTILGLLMFPASLLVAYVSRKYEDRELIVACLWILLIGVCGIINYGRRESYSLMQYVTFGVCIFISSNALEGPNMSLLSNTIPRDMAKGFFNVGLLATEAGTLGRAVGDVLITWCGLDSISYLLNKMFISMGIVVGLTLAGTYRAYPYLEPYDKDD